jgi:transposase
VSTLDHTLKPEPTVPRLEVITGTGQRRRFAVADKARIVEEKLVAGAVVSEAARRHGLTPQQVFTWRGRQACRAALTGPEAPQFVPAIIEPATQEPSALRTRRHRRRRLVEQGSKAKAVGK